MKLYEVPRNTKIRILNNARVPPVHRDFENKEVLDFRHVDGMYSLCYDKDGLPVHLIATAEVEIIEE